MFTKHLHVAAVAALALLLAGGTAVRAEPCEVTQITADAANPGDGADAGDKFGRAVDVDGEFAVVGAIEGELDAEIDSGTAYVFQRDGLDWVQVAQIEGADTRGGDQFGAAAAISGDLIVIGAPNSGIPAQNLQQSGAAYVFRRDSGTGNWALETKLEPTDPPLSAGDLYGTSVAIDGDAIVVGAPGDRIGGNATGAAYVFRFDGAGWIQEIQLAADDGELNDEFGVAVAISGDLAIVGASAENGGGGFIDNSGAAYVFLRTEAGWAQETKLTATSPLQSARFGNATDIDGSVAIIGAVGDKSGPGSTGASSGAAYVFRRTDGSWNIEDKLWDNNATFGDRFGVAVSIRGDFAVVGAENWRPGTTGAPLGAIFVFERDGVSWQPNQTRILPPNIAPLSAVGNSVGMGAGYIVAGAKAADAAAEDAGLAFLIAFGTERDCQPNGEPDDCDILSGTSEDLNQNGTPDDCECAGDGDCDDGIACTANTCNTDVRLCEYPVLAGSCLINGECYDEGAVNPNNECLVCDSTNPLRWSPRTDGTGCTDDGNDCTDDVCSNGACTHPDKESGAACGGAGGNECREDGTCDGAGQCVSEFKPQGTPCGDPSDTDCDRPDTCDGAGQCTDNFISAGVVCGDLTDTECNPADLCDGSGACVVNTVDDGTACTDDGIECTSDTCMAGVCEHEPLADGETCPDDGNECTDDVCTDGQCTHPNKLEGTACGDDLDDDCTDPDTCNASGQCLSRHEADGTACTDDGIECTADACVDGVCTHNDLPNGSACTDDGLFCTGPETCQNGECVSGGDPCTAPGLTCDAAAEAADGCSCASDAACNDGQYCTGVETCVNGACESSGDPCTALGLQCDEQANVCGCDDDADCDDGEFCNGEETCVDGACVDGDPPCADNLLCDETNEECDCDDDVDCDDRLFCTGVETCVNGACQSSGNPCADEGLACDDRGDRCLECLVGADCDDGDACTTDRCPNGECTNTAIAGCNDADGDGVDNDVDLCPGTPAGPPVDDDGCSCGQLDDDGDRVNNCNDRCHNTPAGVAVNAAGCACSQLDEDEDGVDDCEDVCPATLTGEPVDDEGCSESQGDDDDDGITNGIDLCPGTPDDASVDIDGCAASQRDSDNDGVTDDVDQCPATGEGQDVDEAGCPLPDDNGNDNDASDPGAEEPLPNDNANDNSGSGSGSSGQRTGASPCGLFGLISILFMGLGLVAMRLSRRRLS